MMYLFTGYDFCDIEITADNDWDAITAFAIYCGDNSELFQKAIIGCTSLSDLVKMFNRFSSYTVKKVYMVTSLYNEED